MPDLPWMHMLRGMQAVDWGYPFASVDSTDCCTEDEHG